MSSTLSSRAAPYNIRIDRYASFELQLVWKTGGQNPQPVPFEGARALLQVRATIGEPDALFEASSANGKIILNPTSGLISMYLSEDDTSAMQFRQGVYDLIVKLQNGRTYRVIEGEFIVIDGVSVFADAQNAS